MPGGPVKLDGALDLAHGRGVMTRIVAVAALTFGLSAAAADDRAGKDELERFTGTWHEVSVVRDGKDVPKAEAEKVRLVVMGEKYTLTEGGETIEGTHKLDPTKTPKHIDAVRTKGPNKGETLRGLYQLSEDSFVVCFAAPGKDRPTELKPEGGPGLRVLTFKREKK
jgi:uncharacterized protein (TIGR03067 family)